MASLRDMVWHWWRRLHSGAVSGAHLSLAALRASAWRWWLRLQDVTTHVTRLVLGPSTRPAPAQHRPAEHPRRSPAQHPRPSATGQQLQQDLVARMAILKLHHRRRPTTRPGDPTQDAANTLLANLMCNRSAVPDPKSVPSAVLDKALNMAASLTSTSFPDVHERVAWLLAAGANVHANDDRALRRASFLGNAAVVELLLAAGANVHAKDDEPLKNASAAGHVRIVEKLLAAGADVHANDDMALRRASAQGYVRTVEQLLAAGAKVHACNDDALLLASDAGHVHVVEQLLSHGALVNADSRRALTWASTNGHLPVVARLLAAGVDVDYRALRFAGTHGHMAVLDRLIAAAANSGPTGRLDVRNAMVAASHNGQVDVVARYLAAGVPPTDVPWSQADHRPHWRALLLCVGRAHVAHLPDDVRSVWYRLHLCIRLPLRAALFRARARLERPPTADLGVERPTRAELIAHLRTAGRVFAREYWTEGLPLFFPGQDFGPLPDDFIFRPRI